MHTTETLKLGETRRSISSGRARARAAEQRRGKDLVDRVPAGGSASSRTARPWTARSGSRRKVDVVEYLGNLELLHAEAEDTEIVALVPRSDQVQAGDDVEFTVPTNKLHLFDPETEETLA